MGLYKRRLRQATPIARARRIRQGALPFTVQTNQAGGVNHGFQGQGGYTEAIHVGSVVLPRSTDLHAGLINNKCCIAKDNMAAVDNMAVMVAAPQDRRQIARCQGQRQGVHEALTDCITDSAMRGTTQPASWLTYSKQVSLTASTPSANT